jgi:hypothetical protein
MVCGDSELRTGVQDNVMNKLVMILVAIFLSPVAVFLKLCVGNDGED